MSRSLKYVKILRKPAEAQTGKKGISPHPQTQNMAYINIYIQTMFVCVVQTAGTTCGGRGEPCVGRVPGKKFCQSLSVPSCPLPLSTFHPLPRSTVKGFFQEPAAFHLLSVTFCQEIVSDEDLRT